MSSRYTTDGHKERDKEQDSKNSYWSGVWPYVQNVLFGPESSLPRGSHLHEKFKEFINAYAKKRTSSTSSATFDDVMFGVSSENVQQLLDFPSRPHPMQRIPFRLDEFSWKTVKEKIACTPGFWEQSPHLTKPKLQEMLNLTHYFFQYMQKQRFQEMWSTREKQKSLPIYKFKREIVQTVQDYPVTIIAGDTGCGKSTQVPQYLLEAGFAKVACTQPRRLACVALASRVQYETFNRFGEDIGYQIRFEKRASKAAKLLFLTEGILLRQLPSLTETGSSEMKMLGTVKDTEDKPYDVIILDEVHERHLFGDFLLGILKCLLAQRTDIKLVLMSATINTELFRDYFHGAAPVVTVPGFAYPVEIVYRPPTIMDKLQQGEHKRQRVNVEPYIQVLREIDLKFSQPHFQRGDVLIFVSGMKEIEVISQAAKDYAEGCGTMATMSTAGTRPDGGAGKGNWIVLQLHSTLSQEEQNRVFLQPPQGHRKCIVATNIAETSITIDGIRFVVDSGKVKEMSYDADSKLSRLKEFGISRASAEQRKGRAGRTGPGKCFRLYSEKHYDEEMEPFPIPEIQRVNLDSMVLQLLSLGVHDPKAFPFVECPSGDALDASLLSLEAIGAIGDEKGVYQLTPLGTLLAELPVDVMIGKMLVQGCLLYEKKVEAVLTLAALLSIQNPLTNRAIVSYKPSSSSKSSSSMKPIEFELTSDHGDVFTLLKIYTEWLSVKEQRGNSRVWCRVRGIEEQRLYETTKLKEQFRALLESANLIPNHSEEEEDRETGAERSIRHGELRMLKTLKRKWEEERREESGMSSRKKAKRLRRDGTANDSSDEDDKGDLRDVDFRIRFGDNNLKTTLGRLFVDSLGELVAVKSLLASSLYPNLAVTDRFNSYNTGDTCLYHSRSMPGCTFHPTSAFSAVPDCLNPFDETRQMEDDVFSTKHQLVAYTNILETTSKYLINPFRIPAMQSLMLFSKRIDTNADFSRFVFDEWIQIRFGEPRVGLRAFVYGFKLRNSVSEILKLKLEMGQRHPRSKRGSVADSEEKLQKLKKSIVRRIVEYHYETFSYALKRLLKADLPPLYKPGERSLKKETEGMGEYDFNFGYDVLRSQDQDPVLELDFECDICGEELADDPPVSDRMKHLSLCLWSDQDPREEKRKRRDRDVPSKSRSNTQWYCSDCKEDIIVGLSAVEILRHKADHKRRREEAFKKRESRKSDAKK